MSSTVSPRKLIRAAIELHVLETDDVRVSGHPKVAPDGVLRTLVERGLIAEPVVTALARLVALIDAPSQTGGTVVPARGTRFPTRAPTRTPTRAGRPTPGSFPRNATFASERDSAHQPEGIGGAELLTPSSAHGSVPIPRNGTFAPEHDEVRSVAVARSMTFADERDAAAPGPADSVDLSALDPDSKRAVEDAAWCRIAVRRGVVTREQIAALVAETPGAAVSERLVTTRVVDDAAAMMIHVELQAPRAVCAECFEVLEIAPSDDETCPLCKRPWQPRTTAGRSGQTIVGRERAQSIDGFPGEGGVFAGYELLERVAEGGMGVVFRARQTKLNRVVALKVMRGGSLASKARKRRFMLEAEAAASLKHPGIVPVHEIDEVSGYPFYTMDFVEGLALNEHVKSKALAPRAIVDIVRVLSDAVNHFHLHGIIHRDLKPENILVGTDGMPKIIDFGIAKKLGDSTGATIEGDVLGTLHYMSPEQSAGRVREVDTRTDVYALGAILYELLTGAPPWFDHNDARLVVAIQEEDPESIRSKNAFVDSDLEAIVLKAMSKERERRYQSAAELAEDLANHADQRPIRARPATLVYRVKKAVKRRLPAFVAASVTCVFVVSGLGLYTWRVLVARRELASLLTAAEDHATPAGDRQKLLERALFLAPENAVAQAKLDVLVAEQRAADTLAHEQTRRKQENLENQLARERAERDANAIKERERARLDAESQSAAAAEERARSLLEAAKGEKSELTAIRRLDEALASLPRGTGGLRSEVEARKAELEVRQTRAALTASQSGLADFWLQDLSKLDAASTNKPEIDELSARLTRLTSGESDLDEARTLLRGGDLIAARARFEQARASGVSAERVAKDLEAVAKACLARAEALVGDGRASLSSGDAAAGAARAGQARRFAPDFAGAIALESDCATRLMHDARREAALLWRRDDGRRLALAVLDRAVRLVPVPALSAALRRERSARASLLEESALQGLVYVPDVSELSLEAFYVERAEVTNGEFQAFVADRGYERLELWDEAARPLIPTFRDGCSGATCSHHAPRTWLDGGFGDDTNASRPVRGVSFWEARAFARWRSAKTGSRWRLPRDREWEVAAGWDPVESRQRRFPWGDDWKRVLDLGASVAAPAGSAAEDRSPLGAVDCGGNVREWVERRGDEPGTKGADFVCDEAAARHYACVSVTAAPGANPSVGLLRRIGFRLVREIEVER